MLAFTTATANSPYIHSVRRREFRPRGRYVVIVVAAVSVLALAVVSVVIPTSTWAGGGAGSAMTVRVDVKDLSAKQKREFVSAILKAKATSDPNNPNISRYDVFVNWHKNAFRCKNSWKQDGNYAGAAHNSPTFLPWHREYLHRFEAMLQDVSGDPDLALPYWDWTDPQSTKAVFAADFMGGSGDPEQNYAVTDGAFRKDRWTISIQDPPSVLADVTPPQNFIVRNFGSYFDAGIALPTKRQVKDSLDVHKYDHKPYDANSPDARSFRNTLEGWRDATPGECDEGWINVSQEPGSPHVLHNAVHIYVGGLWAGDDGTTTMGTMAYNTSPNDPVFFLHHANVDRIWAAWELEQGQHYRPQAGAQTGWNGDDTMWPWHDRTINSWLSTARNGYVYASLP